MTEYQLSIADLFDSREPDIGEYVEDHGAVIPHIMRPAYIGRKVIYDGSTVSHVWFRCGVLERYFFCEGKWRSVIRVGPRHTILLDHRPGVNIFEPRHGDEYPKRYEKVYGHAIGG